MSFLDLSAQPIYPVEKTENNAEPTDGTKMDVDESLLQKIYVHTSIVPSDSIIPDKEDYVVNDVRRDNIQSNVQPHNQAPSQKQPPSLSNIEPQIMRVLKQLVAKSTDNVITTGTATANRGIRRRRVPATNNRNGRMF